MHLAQPLAPTVSEPLSWDQICDRFPGAWVALVEIDWVEPRGLAIRTARVIGYGKTREAAFEPARPWRSMYGSWAVFLAKRPPQTSAHDWEPCCFQRIDVPGRSSPLMLRIDCDHPKRPASPVHIEIDPDHDVSPAAWPRLTGRRKRRDSGDFV